MNGLPIFLIRRKALGDVLWIEPVIEQLSKQHKKVVVYTKFNTLFENYPLKNVVFKDKLPVIDKLLGWINIFRFIHLDGAYESRPRMHVLHAYQEAAKVQQTDQYPKLYLSDFERKEFIEEKPYVVLNLHTPSEKNYRKVYGIEWDAVVAYLAAQNFQVIYAGRQPSKIPGVKYLDTSIRQLIALIYNASLFIGLDSGPGHIAAALKVPSLLFFGSVNPEYRHFKNLHDAIIMQKPCDFAGCYHEKTGALHGNSCRFVGDEGAPPCTVHTTEEVINNLSKLISQNAER